MKNLLIITSFFFSIFCFSQNNEEFAGKWKGNLDLGTTTLPLVFNTAYKNGEYISFMDSPSQNAYNIPVTKTVVTEKEILWELPNLGISFKGILDSKLIIKGKFNQVGLSLDLLLKKEIEPTKDE